MRVLKVMLLAGALAGLSTGGAVAAGSGGGGSAMSSMPSDTGPRYDPAAEYAKAIAAIQARAGSASPGQLTLAEGESGRLSLEDDAAGHVSLAPAARDIRAGGRS